MTSKLLLFGIATVCILLFTFIYMNRVSPKIIESLVIVFITIAATIIYISKPEEITKNIYSTIFIDRTDLDKNKLLVFFDVPVLNKYYWMYTATAMEHIEKYENKNSKIGIDYSKKSDFLLELLSLLIVDKWRNLFIYRWDVKKEIATISGGERITPKYKQVNEAENDQIHIPFEDFPELLIKNRYNWKPIGYATHSIDEDGNKTKLEGPFHDGGLTFPKNTKFTFEKNINDSPNSYEFSLKKNFFYSVKIKIQLVASGGGLADVAEYIECTAPGENIVSSDKMNQNYWRYVIKINCTAKFNRFTAGNPSTILYKEWVAEIFEDIYDNFDWSVIKNAMSQYIVDKASMNILLDAKKKSGQDNKE